MKKLTIIIAVVLSLVTLMLTEYRFIMCNLEPYYAEDGFLYIEFMGHADTYYAEPIFIEE